MATARVIAQSVPSVGLADVLERVLDKGLVIAGDIKIKLCDVELLSIQIRLLIASVDKAREMGLTWWWQEAPLPSGGGSQPLMSSQHPPPRQELPTRTPWEHYESFRDRRERNE